MRKPGLIAVTIVSTALFLGLAALGLGGIEPFLTDPPLTVVAVATVLMFVASLFTQAGISTGEREDRANRWVLPVLLILGLLGAFVPAWTDRNDLWTLDGEAVRWVGAVAYLAGGILRLWPTFVLGPRFSGLVAIQPGHELVTSGIYRRIRHPSYLGLMVLSVGWALAFRSGIGVLIAAAQLVPLVARMDAEERLLRSHFGSAYDAYCARTARLIPFVY